MSEINKSLLLVSYYFPPAGLGGVQRASKIARHFDRMGWHVVVLTSDYRASQYKDFSLYDELPESIKIVRVQDPIMSHSESSMDSQVKMKSKSGFIARLMRIPDSKIFWINKIRNSADKLVTEHDISSVITTSPPPSIHMIGDTLRKKHQIKWLADFRDPWFADCFDHLTPLHNYIQEKLETKYVKNADVVNTVTETHQHMLIAKYPDHGKKIKYIPNGFDPDDFTSLKLSNPENIVITHCGTMYSRFSIDRFFDTISELLKTESDLKKGMVFRQIGTVDNKIYDHLRKKYDRQISLEFTGYLEHDKALRLMAESSAVIVFTGVSERKNLNVPGKLYEALASNKPALIMSYSGNPAEKISDNLEGVYILNPDNPEQLKTRLKEFLNDIESGKLKNINRRDKLQKYSRETHALMMAKLLTGEQ